MKHEMKINLDDKQLVRLHAVKRITGFEEMTDERFAKEILLLSCDNIRFERLSYSLTDEGLCM